MTKSVLKSAVVLVIASLFGACTQPATEAKVDKVAAAMTETAKPTITEGEVNNENFGLGFGGGIQKVKIKDF